MNLLHDFRILSLFTLVLSLTCLLEPALVQGQFAPSRQELILA